MHQVTVDVQDNVYDGLEQFAMDRGLAVMEGVKWLLGDFVHHNVSHYTPGRALSQLPPVAQAVQIGSSPFDDLLAMSRFLLADNLKKNDTKCPHCQAVLTVKDIEVNGCSSCNKKIV
jgi:hypothetical protein